MATRRWYYLIPATGEPRGLVHAIERHNLDASARAPSRATPAASSSRPACATLLGGLRRVAMEYSPKCAIPYVSRVDAGTVELVRGRGVEVVSSGDLVQQFEALLERRGDRDAPRGVRALYRIKDRAFEAVAARLRDGVPTTEYDIQQLMVAWFDDEGLVSDSAPVVAAQENAGNPHYLPTAAAAAAIAPGRAGAARPLGQADRRRARSLLTSPGWASPAPTCPAPVDRAPSPRSRDARDAAVALVQDAARGRPRAARLGSRPRRAHGARATPASATRSCTAPATASARTCTATACTSTTTKRTTIGGCCRHRVHDRAGPVFRRLSASAPRSTWSGAPRGPEVTGPRQTAIVTLAGTSYEVEDVRCPPARPRCSTRC